MANEHSHEPTLPLNCPLVPFSIINEIELDTNPSEQLPVHTDAGNVYRDCGIALTVAVDSVESSCTGIADTMVVLVKATELVDAVAAIDSATVVVVAGEVLSDALIASAETDFTSASALRFTVVFASNNAEFKMTKAG